MKTKTEWGKTGKGGGKSGQSFFSRHIEKNFLLTVYSKFKKLLGNKETGFFPQNMSNKGIEGYYFYKNVDEKVKPVVRNLEVFFNIETEFLSSILPKKVKASSANLKMSFLFSKVTMAQLVER